MIETLKDYAVKAIVNTVDHLGSVTYKVNEFLDEKVDDVSGTELRVSCVEEVRSDYFHFMPWEFACISDIERTCFDFR